MNKDYGMIRIVNSMTGEMIKYLVMEDYELSKLIGLNTPQSFRNKYYEMFI